MIPRRTRPIIVSREELSNPLKDCAHNAVRPIPELLAGVGQKVCRGTRRARRMNGGLLDNP